MRCENVMQRDVLVLKASDSVLAAAALMRDEDVGFVPIVDEAGRAIGTLTDRDIAVRFVPYDERAGDIPIGEIMTAEVVACAPGDELRVAEKQMRDQRVSRVVVLDDDAAVVGVISLTDVAALGSQRHAARTLRRLAERDYRP